jgi:inosose dehydratase
MTLTRRRWLQGLVAAGIGASLPAAAVERDRACRFGFSLYGMRSVPVGDAVRACAEIGYDGIELALLPGWPTEPGRLTAADRRELGKRLGDSGLALLGLMDNLNEPAEDTAHRANLDRLRAAAELGHSLSPQAPPVIETILGGKPAQWEQVRDRQAERLKAWAETAAAVRTVIAVKPHVANALHMPDAALWLIKQVNSPWLRLAFDYSHFVLRGLPLDRTVAALVPESVFIHVKDAKGTAGKFQFLLPGEGGIDYPAYFKQVQSLGYRGPVVVEVSSQISNRADYEPIAVARRCFAKLAPVLKEAGLRGR